MHPLLMHYLARFSALNEAERHALAEHLVVEEFPKGTILLREGESSEQCYFVLKGCIRQYCLINDEEKTIEFFTEEQAVVLFSSYGQQTPSRYSFVCAEDSTVLVGTIAQEQALYQQFPQLLGITRSITEQHFGKTQEEFAQFITSSPEERYVRLLETRPDLLQRVPQHQIASYLGIMPESLSRIRRRRAQAAHHA